MSERSIFEIGIPLGVRIHHGTKTSMQGVWKAGFQTCALIGLVYNSVGEYVELLDDVWREDADVTEWYSATAMRLPSSPSQRIALVWRNDELLNDDEWSWYGDQGIQLLKTTYSPGDSWRVSYEQKKEIITPALQVGMVPVDKKVVLDGYIFQRHEGFLRRFEVEEVMVFDNTFQAKLRTAWSMDKKGTLKTRAKRIIVGWSFVDEKTIKIEPYEYRAGDEYMLSYTGVWHWLNIEGIEVYYNTNDGTGWSSFSPVCFGDEVDSSERYQIKVVFRSSVRAGSVRARSLVMKVL